jgi:hypothetical protein
MSQRPVQRPVVCGRTSHKARGKRDARGHSKFTVEGGGGGVTSAVVIGAAETKLPLETRLPLTTTPGGRRAAIDESPPYWQPD